MRDHRLSSKHKFKTFHNKILKQVYNNSIVVPTQKIIDGQHTAEILIREFRQEEYMNRGDGSSVMEHTINQDYFRRLMVRSHSLARQHFLTSSFVS